MVNDKNWVDSYESIEIFEAYSKNYTATYCNHTVYFMENERNLGDFFGAMKTIS